MAEPRALSKVVEETTQKSGAGKFQLESSRMLEVNLTGEPVWTKLGTMIGYAATSTSNANACSSTASPSP